MSTSVNVLDDFTGTDGEYPNASLITDANGDLFGTTGSGGTNNDGTVFEITHSPGTGYASTPTVLVSFNAPTEALWKAACLLTPPAICSVQPNKVAPTATARFSRSRRPPTAMPPRPPF